MNKDCIKCLLLSDFTINNLAGYLEKDTNDLGIKTIIPPFNQVKQIMIDHESACWKEKPDVAFVWTRPEGVISSFNKVLNSEAYSIDEVLDEVDVFSDMLKNIKTLVNKVFIASWSYDPEIKSWAMLDYKAGIGIPYTIMQMNKRLMDNFSGVNDFIFLDSQKWVALCGKDAYHAQHWYLSKTPFHFSVFSHAAGTLKSSIRALSGKSRKIIILDLDDTLWGGIVGDLGWENIKLGGHDPVGEAFVDFQKTLKSYKNKGVLLAIVSKNDENKALEVFDKHPEMLLRRDDFAGWKINWGDKAANIAALMKDVNLGFESAVFIDDNPSERARIKESFPEILVPEMPQDNMLFVKTLHSLDCFNTAFFSEEDLSRNRMYAEEKNRRSEKAIFRNIEDWIKTTGIKVCVEKLNITNIERTVQLLNKTNQMNLSTRRMTEKELTEWADEKPHFMWTFTVSDKFGNSGLTGILGLNVIGDVCRIEDFVLSCRVFGRKIEEVMIGYAYKKAILLKCKTIVAEYIPTDKNTPCFNFFKNSGFDKSGNIFSFETTRKFIIPDYIEVSEK